jgi:hypothetical protein
MAPASGPTIPAAPPRRTLRRYTEAEVDAWEERYKLGDSLETIERELGPPASTVLYHLKRRRIARRPCAVPYKHPARSLRPCEREGCHNFHAPTGYQVDKGEGRFCSRACHYASRYVAEPEERVCARKGCEERFTPYPSEAVRPGHGECCTMSCRGKHFFATGQMEAFVKSLKVREMASTPRCTTRFRMNQSPSITSGTGF